MFFLRNPMKNALLFFLTILLLCACSSDVNMEQNILAFHMYSQTQLDLDSENKENVALLAKSFGMEESEVVETQKIILSMKTGSSLRWKFRSAIENKIADLEKSEGMKAREDFVVNVLAPYLSLLTRNELSSVGLESLEFQNNICKLYAKFFPERFKNSLEMFVGDVRFYFDGGTSSVKYLHELNANISQYGYYLDFELKNSSNILKIQDSILPETRYGNAFIRVLNLKRMMPGLLQSKNGYYTIGGNTVIILDDMVNHSAHELVAEMERPHFSKYTDRRFVNFWRSIGLNLDLVKASKIYMDLVKRDLDGKSFAYVKAVMQMAVAVHEAKHLVDNIEHPELTLNIDREFSAHITESIYSPAPYVELFSLINRMQHYAVFNRVGALNETTRRLWELAIRSAKDSSYSVEMLRSDLLELYNNYRTIREHAGFEPLDNFERVVVNGVNEFYRK